MRRYRRDETKPSPPHTSRRRIKNKSTTQSSRPIILSHLHDISAQRAQTPSRSTPTPGPSRPPPPATVRSPPSGPRAPTPPGSLRPSAGPPVAVGAGGALLLKVGDAAGDAEGQRSEVAEAQVEREEEREAGEQGVHPGGEEAGRNGEDVRQGFSDGLFFFFPSFLSMMLLVLLLLLTVVTVVVMVIAGAQAGAEAARGAGVKNVSGMVRKPKNNYRSASDRNRQRDDSNGIESAI